MNNRTKQTNSHNYVAPNIKVVAFKVELGLGASQPRSEALTPSASNPGLEAVTESETGLSEYFNF